VFQYAVVQLRWRYIYIVNYYVYILCVLKETLLFGVVCFLLSIALLYIFVRKKIRGILLQVVLWLELFSLWGVRLPLVSVIVCYVVTYASSCYACCIENWNHFSYTICWRVRYETLRNFWYHTKGQSLVFWHQQWLASDARFQLKFALKLTHPLGKTPTLTDFRFRDSKKSLIVLNRKLTMGFPRSYRSSASITAKTPNGWLEKRFFRFFFTKLQLQSNKVCYKVSFCENFQQQVCIAIPLSNGQ